MTLAIKNLVAAAAFVAADVVRLAILIAVPGLALWLPSLY